MWLTVVGGSQTAGSLEGGAGHTSGSRVGSSQLDMALAPGPTFWASWWPPCYCIWELSWYHVKLRPWSCWGSAWWSSPRHTPAPPPPGSAATLSSSPGHQCCPATFRARLVDGIECIGYLPVDLLDHPLVVDGGRLVVTQEAHLPGQLGVFTNIWHTDRHSVHSTLFLCVNC